MDGVEDLAVVGLIEVVGLLDILGWLDGINDKDGVEELLTKSLVVWGGREAIIGSRVIRVIDGLVDGDLKGNMIGLIDGTLLGDAVGGGDVGANVF